MVPYLNEFHPNLLLYCNLSEFSEIFMFHITNVNIQYNIHSVIRFTQIGVGKMMVQILFFGLNRFMNKQTNTLRVFVHLKVLKVLNVNVGLIS